MNLWTGRPSACYCYLESRLRFRFQATCLSANLASRLKKEEVNSWPSASPVTDGLEGRFVRLNSAELRQGNYRF
jgi:hypothetical protein